LITVLTASKAKFSFYVQGGCLLLNADGFEWNSRGDNKLEGYITSNRTLELKKLTTNQFSFLKSTVEITNISENKNSIVLKTKSSQSNNPNQVNFSTSREIKSILFDSINMKAQVEGEKFLITVEKFEGEKELTINLK
jgi:hypothetical protein